MTFDLDKHREQLQRDLQRRAKELGDQRWEMYKEGVHTGHLNALSSCSPHQATTREACDEWHAIGVRYIDGWAKRHAHNTRLEQS